MSQRGADDWWQKLYGDPETEPVPDPDADPDPDPGDTLESRFHSASSVTALPGPVPSPRPSAEPAQPPPPPPHAVLPGPRRGAAPEPPPPRDPREPGTTGYGLGSVTVPPALPETAPDLPSDPTPPGASTWPEPWAAAPAGTWPPAGERTGPRGEDLAGSAP
ncbi:hypothetical protein ACFCWL_33355, partial [Streptomyces sp. NPDC056387]